LALKHTLKHFQKEIWLKKEQTLLRQTNGSLLKRAKEKVREILSSHIPPQLDDELKREIAQILRNCEKDMLLTKVLHTRKSGGASKLEIVVRSVLQPCLKKTIM